MAMNEMTMDEMAGADGLRVQTGGRLKARGLGIVKRAVAWLDEKGERMMHPLVLSVFALTALAVLLGGPYKVLALTVVPVALMALFSLATWEGTDKA